MKTYTDFEVWIDLPAEPPAEGGSLVYPVRVTYSPAGPATGTLELNLQDAEFKTALTHVRGIGPVLDRRQAFGQRLFEAVFKDEVRDKWQNSRGRVDGGQADGLRLRLWINVPELAALPWELLYEEGKGFLATSSDLAVSRYLPVPEPPLLTALESLRILVVVESPQGLPTINPQEVQNLEAALQGLGPAVEYEILRNVPVAPIQNALQQGFHVLHFLGHGTAGKLALTKEDGQDPLYIDDREFAQLFLGRRDLRLVVLNACSSSQAAEGGLFAGMGPALVQKQMPAVVAMQYPTVQLTTASQFSQAFYGALANGIPVDFAVNEGRQQLSAGELLHGRDWSTPVLYMGTRTGRILNFLKDDADSVDRAWQSVQDATKESAEAEAALAELSQRFQEVASRHRELGNLTELSALLSDVQDGLDPCLNIVRDAGFDFNKLMTQFATLKSYWDQVQGHQMIKLDAFVQVHPDLDMDTWYQALQDSAAAVDSDLAQVSVGSLANSVSAFGRQLRQARARVHHQLNQGVLDLVRISDRTLGRLAAV
jgi:hypothetical protein